MESKFQLKELLGIGMTLVVLGIGIAYGLQVVGDVRDDMGEASCAGRDDNFTSWNVTGKECYNASLGAGYTSPVGTEEWNATVDTLSGVSKIPEKLPTIATVVVAAVILGILVTYLWARFR